MPNDDKGDWAVKVTLASPIEIKTKESGEVISRVEEIRFKAPTGGDFIDIGNPVLMDVFAEDPTSTMRFDNKVMAAMFARLSGELPSTIRRMTPSDFARCSLLLAGFFLPARIGA